MHHRMIIALLSMVGFFLSLYLALWKMGLMGTLSCGTGTCEAVQTSEYAFLFGIPVAWYGVGGYLALLIAAIIGVQPQWVKRREPSMWLLVLSSGGVAFTAYLSYLEAFVIHAWCRWCLGSAAIIGAIFISAVVGWMNIGRTSGGVMDGSMVNG